MHQNLLEHRYPRLFGHNDVTRFSFLGNWFLLGKRMLGNGHPGCSFIAPSLRRTGDQVEAHTQGRRPPRRLTVEGGGLA